MPLEERRQFNNDAHNRPSHFPSRTAHLVSLGEPLAVNITIGRTLFNLKVLQGDGKLAVYLENVTRPSGFSVGNEDGIPPLSY